MSEEEEPMTSVSGDIEDKKGEPEALAEPDPAEPGPGRRGRKPKAVRPPGPRGSDGAKKAAAVVLEVLTGQRDTGSAGEALGVSLSRYYVLEARAVQGLVKALEPRPKGKQKSPEKALIEARQEVVRLRRDLAATQALLRVTQRGIGLKPAAKREKRSRLGSSTEKVSKVKRRRRMVRRATQVIDRLRSELDNSLPPPADEPVTQTVTPREAAQCLPADPPGV